MSAGNRTAIFDSIDRLDEARTVAELVHRLKPILSELAYYGVTGEASVMETGEEWHSEFHSRLLEAEAQDRRAAAATAASAALPGHGAPPAAANPRGKPKKRGVARQPPGGGGGTRDLSPALRSILNGTHHSFNEAGQ